MTRCIGSRDEERQAKKSTERSKSETGFIQIPFQYKDDTVQGQQTGLMSPSL